MHLVRIIPMLGVSAVAALAIGACGGSGTSTTAETTGASGTPASTETPSVEFVEPTDGSTTSDEVTAEVELSGFEIDPKAVGDAKEEGAGHLHFSMDGGKYDTPEYSGANGELAVELGVDGQYSPSTEPTITYSGLPKGEHTLEVYLANNDHSDTGVEATTSFEVK